MFNLIGQMGQLDLPQMKDDLMKFCVNVQTKVDSIDERLDILQAEVKNLEEIKAQIETLESLIRHLIKIAE